MLRILLIISPQLQQGAVRFLNDPSDIFFQNARQVAALAHRVLIGALALLTGEQINSAPNDGDDRDTEIGRGLSERLNPICHTDGSRSFTRAVIRVPVY